MYETLKHFILTRKPADEAALQRICACFSPVKTARREILLDRNQVCRHYYFINSGAMRIFTTDQEGNESSRYFAFEGNFITALPSFIDQLPADEYLQSIEPSDLLRIGREDFYRLVATEPAFAAIYTEILELGFINAQKRIYGFQSFDAEEKVKWVIRHQPLLLQRLSNKMAATYLGLSPSTLSRIKSRI